MVQGIGNGDGGVNAPDVNGGAEVLNVRGDAVMNVPDRNAAPPENADNGVDLFEVIIVAEVN